MTAYQRTKGHNFERKIASLFRAIFPNAKRGLDQSRNNSTKGIKGNPDVDVPMFWIECKIGRRTNIKAALLQAEQATDGRIPVAICQDDRQPATATMRLEHFSALLAQLQRQETA